MSAKENTLSKLNMNIDSLRAQMEDTYLLSSKALSEADARIEEAEAKSKTSNGRWNARRRNCCKKTKN